MEIHSLFQSYALSDASLGPKGPRDASDQNVAKYLNFLIWGPLQLCFYEASPNSNLLFSELEIALLFQDFPGAIEPSGCLVSKSCKIPKCHHLGSPSILL